MSFDRWWVCKTADPSTWTERGKAEKQGKLLELEAELTRLEEQGHIVVLEHGRNYLFDELYAFEREADAVAFYEDGYKRRERVILNRPDCGFPERGGGFGFHKVRLYLNGVCRASKSENPNLVVEHAYKPCEGASSSVSPQRSLFSLRSNI